MTPEMRHRKLGLALDAIAVLLLLVVLSLLLLSFSYQPPPGTRLVFDISSKNSEKLDHIIKVLDEREACVIDVPATE